MDWESYIDLSPISLCYSVLQEDAHIYSARYTSKNKCVTIQEDRSTHNSMHSWVVKSSATQSNLLYLNGSFDYNY